MASYPIMCGCIGFLAKLRAAAHAAFLSYKWSPTDKFLHLLDLKLSGGDPVSLINTQAFPIHVERLIGNLVAATALI